MSGHYDKQGIQFYFPENWRITDDETLSWPKSVSVQSPTGGFWSVMVYQSDQEPSSLTEHVLSTMRSEYEDVEATEIDEEFDGIRTAGYDMLFYCLDFVVNSRTLAARSNGRTFLFLWQAEDGEFETLEAVFRAITTSLFRA